MLAERLTEFANALQIAVGIVAAFVILTNLKHPKVILTTLFASIIMIGALASQTWAEPIFDGLMALLGDVIG